MRCASPLRYPGGKWRLSSFFEHLIARNFDRPPVYIEPYAGGASLALSLLFADRVEAVFLNDLDPAIFSFWDSVLRRNGEFCDLVRRTKVTPQEWRRQREIYRRGLSENKFALGFSTFFLNRTNHSGILNAGMIGGEAQKGKWRVSARFNPDELVRRLERVHSYKERIRLSCSDAAIFLHHHRRGRNKLIYLDPPYFGTGRNLYYSAYRPSDHIAVRDAVLKLKCHWLVSYDNVKSVRELYRCYRARRIQWRHTARVSQHGNEIIYFSPQLVIPSVCPGRLA